mmetsp:Transcript_4104/g.6006  ORF Transcript_4104/g.6006 Transcript_4104/m.6006 type:complete len:376 (-) Transcript_4104:901-2028(-)
MLLSTSNRMMFSVRPCLPSKSSRMVVGVQRKFFTANNSPPPSRSLLNLKGKVAFIAGVGDSSGYGWAIAKALADAGATILVGTWPPLLRIFERKLQRGSYDEARVLSLSDELMNIEKIYPLDVRFDQPADIPEELNNDQRYTSLEELSGVKGCYTVSEVARSIQADYGKLDILVHAVANGPEASKPLLETSREGYLAASSASAYSLVSLVQHMGPLMETTTATTQHDNNETSTDNNSSVLSLSFLASTKVVPGYGGGMSSAKAQLESDTRTLAYEAGRKWGIRVNTISAPPLRSRAATAISTTTAENEVEGKPGMFIEYAIQYYQTHAPLQTTDQNNAAEDIANAGLFLSSPMARGITGVTLYVDNGFHVMGMNH